MTLNGSTPPPEGRAAAQQIRQLMANVDLADLPGNRCPCCNDKLVAYKHCINTGILSALYRLSISGGVANANRELGLNHNQAANFQKLQYWGLIAPVMQDNNPNVKEKGMWSLTPLGLAWLNGEQQVRKTPVTFRKDVIEMTGPLITPDDVNPEYRQIEDYTGDARGLHPGDFSLPDDDEDEDNFHPPID